MARLSVLVPALIVTTIAGVALGQSAPPQTNEAPKPVPQPLSYPAVPGALPPGLYRAGAQPIAPPGFYDLSYYYNSGYAPYGGVGYGGYGPGFGYYGGLNNSGYYSNKQQIAQAQVPYRAAVRDAQDYHYRNQIYRRDESLLARSASLTSEGSALLRAGFYDRAAVTLMAAAEANHDDALSRVRAGHALFSIGRYDEAVRHLRRAFELQPPLATLNYDIRDDYSRPGDFDLQLAALERFVAARPRSVSGTLMLAYVRYYTTGAGSAYPLLRRAKWLDPQNELVDKLIAVSGQVYSPNAPTAPQRVAPTPAATPTARPATPSRSGSDMRQARLDAR